MLSDEDIKIIIDVELGDQGIAQLLRMMGVEGTGDTVEDLKILAAAMGVDPEDLLYALFADEDMFADTDWTNLTNGDDT